MEDTLKPEETFSPDIFAQATEIAKSENLPSPFTPQQPTLEIDEETARICVEIPFDIAAHFTKLDAMKLHETEAQKLGKLWRKPLERLLAKNPNSDIILACYATAGIAMEKYAEYKLAVEHRN